MPQIKKPIALALRMLRTDMSDEREILIRTADRLFAEIATPERLLGVERGEWRADDWQTIAEAGLPLALVPEEAGGFGLSVADALSIVRRVGFHALALPLPEAMLAGRIVVQAGLSLPDGVITLATDAADDGLTCLRQNEGWRITGTLKRVPWARHADHILAVADGMLVLLPQAAIAVRPGTNLAGEPRDDILVDAIIDAAAVAPATPTWKLRSAGAATRAIQIAGAIERLLIMTSTYANERTQFGRSIGKFQAIQQYMAVLAGHVAAATAAADIAADALANGDTSRSIAIAIAKSRAGEAAGAASAIAHQIHGAIGITREHSLNFYTRRLWSWREEFGGEGEWSAEIGRQFAAGGADALWPMVAAA